LNTIKQFADVHGLKVRTDEDGTKIIPGIDDRNIYEYDGTRLGVMYMDSLAKDHSTHRKQCVAAGMEVTQDGDDEFAAVFDPSNEKQAKLAVKVAGCRFPGRRKQQALKNFVNCVVSGRGTCPEFASVALG